MRNLSNPRNEKQRDHKLQEIGKKVMNHLPLLLVCAATI